MHRPIKIIANGLDSFVTPTLQQAKKKTEQFLFFVVIVEMHFGKKLRYNCYTVVAKRQRERKKKQEKKSDSNHSVLTTHSRANLIWINYIILIQRPCDQCLIALQISFFYWKNKKKKKQRRHCLFFSFFLSSFSYFAIFFVIWLVFTVTLVLFERQQKIVSNKKTNMTTFSYDTMSQNQNTWNAYATCCIEPQSGCNQKSDNNTFFLSFLLH